MINHYPEIPPRTKPFKRAINKVVLFVLGRALQSLSKADPLIRAETATWLEGFTLAMLVKPKGGSMTVRRMPDLSLKYLGSQFPNDEADVTIYINEVESAFKMFTGQLGSDVAYARHSISAKGDLSYTVSVVRVINVVEAYLFPRLISRGLMKEPPPIPWGRRQSLRLKTYLLGILFGI